MLEKGHVDLETIEAYLGGKLAAEEAEAVKKHLASCPICNLERERLERFARIDADEDLSRQAEWPYASRKLERAFKERIASSPARRAARAIASPRAAHGARWLLPAAAAALVVMVGSVLLLRGRPETPAPARGVTSRAPGVSREARGVMRGAPPAAEYGIELKAPVGELAAFPEEFKWESTRENDYFALEIFTPSLEKIYETRNVIASSWKVPDSLKTVLKPNVIYLWSVRGYKGLERAVASRDGWFKIKPGV